MVNYTVRGSGTIEIDGSERTVHAGDLIFLNSYLHHTLKPIAGQEWVFYFVHIYDNTYVSDIYQRFVSRNGFIVSGIPKEAIAPYIAEICQNLSSTKEPDEMRLSALTYTLLMSIIDLKGTGSANRIDLAMQPIVSYIQANYMNHITVSDVVAKSVYSKNHLERLFKDSVGATISDYLAGIRFSKAQELILTSGLSFKEIADNVGLSDYRALYHMFVTKLGVTPKEFKEQGEAKNTKRARRKKTAKD